MHEMSIASSLLRIVQESMQRNEASKLCRVKLIAGRMNAIVPEALQAAFDLLSRGTSLEGAELDIEAVPVALRCVSCRRVFHPEGEGPMLFPLASCPFCGSESGHRLQSGRELFIEYIEAE